MKQGQRNKILIAWVDIPKSYKKTGLRGQQGEVSQLSRLRGRIAEDLVLNHLKLIFKGDGLNFFRCGQSGGGEDIEVVDRFGKRAYIEVKTSHSKERILERVRQAFKRRHGTPFCVIAMVTPWPTKKDLKRAKIYTNPKKKPKLLTKRNLKSLFSSWGLMVV